MKPVKFASVIVNPILVVIVAAAWKHLDEPDFVRAVGGHNIALIAC